MRARILHFYRSFRWWLFSKTELAHLIRGLQGQIGYCHREIDALRAKLARYETAVQRENQHILELRDCTIVAEETHNQDGLPLTNIMVQPHPASEDAPRSQFITVHGARPVSDW